MKTSEQINELCAALAKAQGKIVGAVKDSSNPFFRSKYADLASCWEACREQLSSNGLAVIQMTECADTGIAVTTRLTHSSGQWVESTMLMHPKDDTPQAAGSAITYARRYGLAAVVGLAQVDDDAEAAQGRSNANIHSPKGELGKNVEVAQARVTAETMRSILAEDLEEDMKAMRVADMHDLLRAQHDLYVAAADQMHSKERAAWKAYLSLAQKKQAAEPNGRAA